jgi:hypothetical protein
MRPTDGPTDGTMRPTDGPMRPTDGPTDGPTAVESQSDL